MTEGCPWHGAARSPPSPGSRRWVHPYKVVCSLRVQAVQLGPFDVGSQEGWQQFAATLGALGGMPAANGPAGGAAAAQPGADGAAAGAAAGRRASPFDFGNIFGGAAATRGGGGGRGRGGRGAGRGAGRGGQPGAAQQQAAAAWWQHIQQELSRQMSGMNVSLPGDQQAHLLDGLDRLLLAMERGGGPEGAGAAPGGGRGGRRRRTADEEALPPIHAFTQGGPRKAAAKAALNATRSQRGHARSCSLRRCKQKPCRHC